MATKYLIKHADQPHVGPFVGKDRFLSNFYGCPIYWLNLMFPSVENAFQASKSLDCETQKRFVELSPSAAKRLGREIECRPDWEEVKIPFMEALLDLKFQYAGLRALLIATYPKPLIEFNYWHDNLWGDCTCGFNKCREIGRNQLGVSLMKTRENCMKEDRLI